jgi:hypothetical protein
MSVFFGRLVPAVVPDSRVSLLRRRRAWWWCSWSSLRDVSTTCGSILSPVSSSRVGWEVGSRPPLGASGSRHLTLALLLRYSPFLVFECCWMRRSWGVGMRVRSFPLLG